MVMCHCTFNRKASVAANEYLIQGELANLPDSIVIGLYEEDGSILNCVWRDTLMNGQFSFRDTVSTTRKMLIMSDNRGFPGTWLEVWIAPGEYIEIKGQDKLVKTWEVVSGVPEQQEENRFTACAMAQQKELMQYMAAEYDWQRMMFIDHPGDREFESQAWAKIDSIRKLSMPLQQEIWKKEMEYMEEAPVSPVWMDRLLFFASMMKYKTIMPYKEEVKNSMPECPKPINKQMTDRRLQPMFILPLP